MQAKPGRQKPPQQQTAIQKFSPPTKPAHLTQEREKVWSEICANPFLNDQDGTLVLEFMKLVALRDVAFEVLQQQGLMIDDAKGSFKTNPSYKCWRDTSDRLLKLRDHLLMTPNA
jgi:P27 family predicted phage terminase small subunit